MTESESIQFVRLGYTLYSLIHIITLRNCTTMCTTRSHLVPGRRLPRLQHRPSCRVYHSALIS